VVNALHSCLRVSFHAKMTLTAAKSLKMRLNSMGQKMVNSYA
jgi:hypothetical protein